MQGSSPHRHQSIDFDPAVLPNFDVPDLNHPNELSHELDDIRVEYHLHSKYPSTIHHFSEFSCSRSSEDQVPCSNSPWEPFRTQLESRQTTCLTLCIDLPAAQTHLHCRITMRFTHYGRWLRSVIHQ